MTSVARAKRAIDKLYVGSTPNLDPKRFEYGSSNIRPLYTDSNHISVVAGVINRLASKGKGKRKKGKLATAVRVLNELDHL